MALKQKANGMQALVFFHCSVLVVFTNLLCTFRRATRYCM
jgi:hypothetical protein